MLQSTDDYTDNNKPRHDKIRIYQQVQEFVPVPVFVTRGF